MKMLSRLWLVALAFVLLSTDACEKQAAMAENKWLVNPEEVAIDPTLIDQLEQSINTNEFSGIHSLLIMRGDKLVYESYYNGYSQSRLHPLYSVTKSFSSLMVGVAIQEGLIVDEQVPLSGFFPEYQDRFRDGVENVTLTHLLSMTSGYLWDESTYSAFDSRSSFYQMDRAQDQVDYVLSRQLEASPGEVFNYNTGTSNLIAPIIEKASGMDVESFMEKKIFEPLSIDTYRWDTNFNEYPSTGGYRGGLWLTPRDMIKLGQLYLKGGQYNGIQVIDPEWIKKSTGAKVAVTQNWSYAYHWWTRTNFEWEGHITREYDALGSGGQWIFVFPDLDLVLAFTSGNYTWEGASPGLTYQPVQMIRDHILPSIIR